MGGYERESAPWALDEHLLDAIPAGLQRPPARRGLAALRGDRGELAPARAGDGRDHRHAADQRPRGVHARQRVLPRRERGRGLLRRRGLLRARPRRRGRDRQGDGRVDPRRASRRSTCGRWTSAASGRTTARPPTRSSAPGRSTRPTTTSATPATSARPAGRCAPPAPTPGTPSTARRSARSPAGSASTGTSPTPPAATSRCARAAGRGCTGRRRSAPSTARTRERAGLFDESSFAKLEVAGPGAAGFLEAALRQPRRARGRARSPTRRCSTAAAGSSATSPSRGSRRSCSRSSPGTAFGNHDLSWIRRHAPARRQRALHRRHRALGVLRAVGPARARDPRAADRPTRSTSPTCGCARSPSATSRSARCA